MFKKILLVVCIIVAYVSAQRPFFQGIGQGVGQAFGQVFENAAERFVDQGRNTIGDFFSNQGGGFGGNQNNGGGFRRPFGFF